MTNINLPNRVTRIDNLTFSGCSSLTGILIPDSVTSIGTSAFENCTGLTSISIPNGIITIGRNAFERCTSLTRISIPDGGTSIDLLTFSDCTSLTSISIPDSVTSIHSRAFEDCTSLTSIIIPGTTRPAYTLDIDRNFTVYCHECSDVDFWAVENGYNVSYPDDLTAPIEFNVATPSTNMESGTSQTLTVTILPQVSNPAIARISSAPAIASVANGVVTAKAPGTVNITATYGSATASVDLEVYAKAQAITFSPAELWVITKETATVRVNVLPMGASCSLAVNGHDSTTISPAVFGNIIKVLALRPGDTTFTVIDSFSGLSKICTVHVVYAVPYGVQRIGQGAFYENANLTSIELPDSVVYIEEGAFGECTSLTSIVIPDSVTSIGKNAFVDCRFLQSVTIPDSVTYIGEGAFDGCHANLLISVTPGSYADRWCNDNNLPVFYPDPNSWLLN